MRLFSSYAANRVHAVSAQRATIKFRYFNLSGSEAFLLPYFEKLIFTTYIRQIFNQLSSQISSYLNNRNLKIIISKISRSNPKHFLNLRIDSLREFQKRKSTALNTCILMAKRYLQFKPASRFGLVNPFLFIVS